MYHVELVEVAGHYGYKIKKIVKILCGKREGQPLEDAGNYKHFHKDFQDL